MCSPFTFLLLLLQLLLLTIPSASSLRLFMSNREIKILIQGTKNAYTTIRKNDIILYKLDPTECNNNDNKQQSKGLGVLLDDDVLFPLCNYHSGRYILLSTIFYFIF